MLFHRQSRKCALCLVCVFSFGVLGQSLPAQEPESTENNGQVTSVTLYRSQAMVTRTLSIEGSAGSSEVVVGNLPENIVANSLFAESSEDVEVRAVQFRTRAVGASPREEVRDLQDQLQVLNDKIQLNQKKQALAQKQYQYLDNLEKLLAPSASEEFSDGVLDAEALSQVTTFFFDNHQSIAEQQIELEKESRGLQEQHQLLNRQLSEITNGTSKTVREAVLYIQKQSDLPQEVRLNYLVNQCGWSPNYTIRASGDQEATRIEYNGLIHQMSGEDWSDVDLTLSTASPALSATRPGLAPFRVVLTNGAQQQELQMAANAFANPTQGQLAQIITKQQSALRANMRAVDNEQLAQSTWGLNDAANEFACVELIGDYGVVNVLKSQIEEMAEEPSLSYRLSSTATLPSRNSQQMVRIIQTELPSKLFHVATPVLTSYVYREAEVTNDSPEDFLAGPISVYLDGKFVGRGEIPTVARGQAFVVGFGADPQLRTRRELAEKKDGINGGNRELKFDYRLVVENFKNEPVSIRLVDRLPTAKDNGDIRITLNSPEEELSEDTLYTRVERPEGILRWDIDVPADSMGDEAKIVNYSFTVEYDRNFLISVPGSNNQLKLDFERLERVRAKR